MKIYQTQFTFQANYRGIYAWQFRFLMHKNLSALSIAFLFLALFSGCSRNVVKNENIFPTAEGVNHVYSENELEQIKLNENLKDQNVSIEKETIRLGAKGGEVFLGDSIELKKSNTALQTLKLGLNLGPGLNLALAHTGLLKTLDRHNLIPKVITGSGFGLLIAAMYSAGMTPEVIEWNFFKYFKEKRNNRIFEKEWIEDVEELLISKIKNKNIEDFKIKLIISLYDPKFKKVVFFEKGNFKELFILNLIPPEFYSKFKIKKSKFEYDYSLNKEAFNRNLLLKLGANFTIASDVFGKKNYVLNNDPLMTRLYNDVLKIKEKNLKNFDFLFKFPSRDLHFDADEEVPEILQMSQNYSTKQMLKLLNRIHSIKDENE